MITVIIEAALRSLVLGALVWVALRILRIRHPQLERNAWIAVLVAACAMPWIMQLELLTTAITPSLPWNPYVDAVTATATSTDPAWTVLAMELYVTIAGVLIARQILGLVKAWKLRRTAIAYDEVSNVRTSERMHAPATVFSTVIVPVTFRSWPAEQQRAAIAHEHAHVANFDFYVQQVARFHRGIFWFNPFAWWLARRLSILNEHISDDAALRVMPHAASYAEFLLQFAKCATDEEHAVAMARPTTLVHRIERILGNDANPRPPHAVRKAAVISALTACVVIVAGFSTTVANAVAPTETQNAAAASMPEPTTKNSIALPHSNPARALSQPVYPPPSRRLHEAGTVVLRLLVLPDGRVSDAVVHKSSGFIELDNAARYESFRWHLDPGTVKGEPTPMWGKFAVTFKLDE
jgi:TonB family protein